MEKQYSEFWQDLSPALRPVYTTPKINQPILLYEGSLEIIQNDTTFKGNGNIEFVWFPKTDIKFSFSTYNQQHYINHEDSHVLNIVDKNVLVNVLVLNSSINNEETSASGYFSDAVAFGSKQKLTSVIFHLVNFHNFIGRPCAALVSETNRLTIERNTLEAEDWKITLDQLESTSSHAKELNDQGGFSITHVAKLEKVNQELFNADEAVEFLKICSSFFSFVRGFRIPAILLVGYNSDEERIWEYWMPSRGVSWIGVNSWFPLQENQVLNKVFPGFLTWWRDWGSAADIALHWYLESNVNAGALEGSIVLAQVALELIGWTLLVEQEKVISAEGFDKIWASDKLRLLLSKLKIPIQLPPKYSIEEVPDLYKAFAKTRPPILNNLVKLAANRKWVDGPHAFTELRNGIVHPKKLSKVLDADPLARYDACSLGLWYLELSLLALCLYQGRYSNRLVIPRQSGETESVPWAKE